jgi:hypothetical protein
VQALGGDSGLPGVQSFTADVAAGPVSVLVGASPFESAKGARRDGGRGAELRLRTAVVEHRSWFTIDIRGRRSPATRPWNAASAALAAALLDADSVAICNDDRGFAAVTERTASVLATEPALAFTLAPATGARRRGRRDAALAAAIAKARASFRFEIRLSRPARWRDLGASSSRRRSPIAATEHLWVKVTAIAADTISGTVDNEPVRSSASHETPDRSCAWRTGTPIGSCAHTVRPAGRFSRRRLRHGDALQAAHPRGARLLASLLAGEGKPPPRRPLARPPPLRRPKGRRAGVVVRDAASSRGLGDSLDVLNQAEAWPEQKATEHRDEDRCVPL